MNYGDKYFRTSDFYGAAFLYLKGLQLIKIERTEATKSFFVFIDKPEREKLIYQYGFAERNSTEVMVDAREYEKAVRTLKNILYQLNP